MSNIDLQSVEDLLLEVKQLLSESATVNVDAVTLDSASGIITELQREVHKRQVKLAFADGLLSGLLYTVRLYKDRCL